MKIISFTDDYDGTHSLCAVFDGVDGLSRCPSYPNECMVHEAMVKMYFEFDVCGNMCKVYDSFSIISLDRFLEDSKRSMAVCELIGSNSNVRITVSIIKQNARLMTIDFGFSRYGIPLSILISNQDENTSKTAINATITIRSSSNDYTSKCKNASAMLRLLKFRMIKIPPQPCPFAQISNKDKLTDE